MNSFRLIDTLHRVNAKLMGLDKDYEYVNDGEGRSFPWYSPESIVTLEGPTDKYSIFNVGVRISNFVYLKFYLLVV